MSQIWKLFVALLFWEFLMSHNKNIISSECSWKAEISMIGQIKFK